MSINALFTWRDVADALRTVPSPPWHRAIVDMGSATLWVEPGSQHRVEIALSELFGSKFGSMQVRLESLSEAQRTLAVEIVDEDPQATALGKIVRPLWQDADLASTVPQNQSDSQAPRILAFYSYKGGVGRTTTLLAVARELLTRKKPARLLIIDADLEAPGLSFLVPRVTDRLSFLDFLGLIHDEEDWRSNAIPLAASRLHRSVESLELPEGRCSFHFLPSFRSPDQLFPLRVIPEQLVRARGRANIVAEAILALTAAIQADAALVDLRAGITEFASPFLLDPRVQSILVTSCNQQSIDGTVEVLERMRSRIQTETSPEIVLSMIPPGEAAIVPPITERLLGVLAPKQDSISADQIHEVSFAQELLHYQSLDDLMSKRLAGTELGKRVARSLVNNVFPQPDSTQLPPSLGADGLERLVQEAQKLEYAEQNDIKDLLPTGALTALAEYFSDTLPATIVLGSKGAGKTFAFGQLILGGSWKTFCQLIRPIDREGIDANVFPLLGPRNASDALNTAIRTAENRVRQLLSTSKSKKIDALGAELQNFSDPKKDELEFWLEAIQSRLGLSKKASKSVEALESEIRDSGQKVLLVIDGFEDVFQVSPGNPLTKHKQRLMRGLLQRLVPDLRALESTAIGIVVLIRRDLAEDSIQQNFGQFESLYSKFTLVWSPTEALRLAAWLFDRAGKSVLSRERIPAASYEELRLALQKIWGIRMGSNNSKEAYTDRWVIAALSDLQGRLQPRDIVRLIRYAAESGVASNTLQPQALRGALKRCSEEKIRELEQEVLSLKPLFEAFRKAPLEKKMIPFMRSDFKLSEAQVVFLRRQGVVTTLEDGEELYMPEIIRQGLGFKLKEGRRAKVLALYRAAQLRNIEL